MPVPKQTTINDPVANRIIEHNRVLVGDKAASRTAGRIIQAFHNSGLTLVPDSECSTRNSKDRQQHPGAA